MTYDAADGYIVLFGGDSSPHAGRSLNDTWKFSSGKWVNITSKVAPRTRDLGAVGGFGVFGGLTFDAADGYVVLFGGLSCLANRCVVLRDTWKFSGGYWTNVTPRVSPPQCFGDSLTYDPISGYTLLVQTGTGSINGLNCHWTWSFLNGTWTNLSSRVSSPGGYNPETTYDPHGHFDFMFMEDSSKDTWEFKNGSWTNIALKPRASSPSTRIWPMMVYDARAKGVILFGGANRSYLIGGCATFGDTMEFHGGRWTLLSPANSPPARFSGSIAYYPPSGEAVLFGGSTCGSLLADTWVLR